MRIILLLALLSEVICYGQKPVYTHAEIQNKILDVRNNSIYSDSLQYLDSTCSYFHHGKAYTGYVIQRFGGQLRFHLYADGIYYGEEWVFKELNDFSNSDSLIPHLQQYRVRCDTNHFYTIVTSYYDFTSNRIHEIYLEPRYQCAITEEEHNESFDIIFGGYDFHTLPYKSFYPNGNKKEVSIGDPHRNGEVTMFYENGKKKLVRRFRKNGDNGFIKEKDENGKCTRRIKGRNKKIRGIYVIMDGKFNLSIIVRHQLEKQKNNL